jgi:FKBP-type peptidyl-prolyl cis-trans isomerase FkpA
MIRLLTSLLTLLFAATTFAADAPMNDEQKTLYAIGLNLSKSISGFNLTPAELEVVLKGFTDGQSGKKSEVEPSLYFGKIQALAKARRKAMQAAADKDFLEKAAKEPGAITTASGMIYVALSEGMGESPKAADVVKVNYRGTLVDGTEFDSSYKLGKPLEFKLDNVIKCWTEGLQKMKPGGKAKLVCPAQLAYGDAGAGKIQPGATLAFEVELLEVRQSGGSKLEVTVPAQPAEPAKK